MCKTSDLNERNYLVRVIYKDCYWFVSTAPILLYISLCSLHCTHCCVCQLRLIKESWWWWWWWRELNVKCCQSCCDCMSVDRAQNCSCPTFWPTKTFCSTSWSSWKPKRRWMCCSSTYPLVCQRWFSESFNMTHLDRPGNISQLIMDISFHWFHILFTHTRWQPIWWSCLAVYPQ